MLYRVRVVLPDSDMDVPQTNLSNWELGNFFQVLELSTCWLVGYGDSAEVDSRRQLL